MAQPYSADLAPTLATTHDGKSIKATRIGIYTGQRTGIDRLELISSPSTGDNPSTTPLPPPTYSLRTRYNLPTMNKLSMIALVAALQASAAVINQVPPGLDA